MRWVRWTLGGVVALALLVMVAGAFGGGSTDCPTVSVAAPLVSFVGTVGTKDGDAVTYVVESWQADRLPPGNPQLLSPGDRVVIDYLGGDARFLHTGQRYQVDATGNAIDQLTSDVHTSGECTFGSATVHADGSSIDTGLWTRDGIEPYVGRIALGVLLLGVAALGTVAYRRVKHPRLTIDGQRRR